VPSSADDIPIDLIDSDMLSAWGGGSAAAAAVQPSQRRPNAHPSPTVARSTDETQLTKNAPRNHRQQQWRGGVQQY
jgi:hypothetical protein